MFLSRRSKIWYLFYDDEGGIRRKVSTHATSKKEANEFLRSFKGRKHKAPLLSDYEEQLLTHYKHSHRPGTLIIFKAVFAHLKEIAGDKPLARYTLLDFDSYRSARLSMTNPNDPEKKRTVSPVTVNIELRTLKSIFQQAMNWELIDKTPFKLGKFARVDEVPPRFLTFEQFTELANSVREPWLKALIIVATVTGMRRGELLNLKWEDVDLQAGMISVHSSATFKTKSGRRRAIPIHPLAASMLSSLPHRSEYVFSIWNVKLKKFWKIGPSWVTHLFKRYVRPINPELRFHSLRHTFASWLVYRGVEIQSVQRLMGHSTSKMTEVYSHLLPDQLRNAMDRLQLPRSK